MPLFFGTHLVSRLSHVSFYHHLVAQSADCTVFFFTVGEKYNPIGFIRVPGPIQALEWSPNSHVSYGNAHNRSIVHPAHLHTSVSVMASLTFLYVCFTFHSD